MILRGADIKSFIMSVEDRKIRRDLNDFFNKQTIEYEVDEVEIMV